MTLKEFSERLESDFIEDKIVSLRYKYSFEKDWTYSNEILEVDMNVEGNYVWLNDWNEGQEEIEILGYVNVSDVMMISSIMNVGGAISRQAAIDALCSVCGVDCDKSKFVYGGKQEDQVIFCPEHYALTQLPSAQTEITLEKAVRIVLDFIQSAPGTTTWLTMPDGTSLNTDWGYVEEGLTEIVNYFERKKNE